MTDKIQKVLEYPSTVMCGGDPELFFFDKHNKVVSSDTIVEKGKNEGNGCDIINDGVQGELNFRPDSCRVNVVANIRVALVKCAEVAKNDYRVSSIPIVSLNEKQLTNLSEDAKKFGCEPDYSAYQYGEPNVKDFDGSKLKIRFAGGHIHLGWNDKSAIGVNVLKKINDTRGVKLAKLMDIMVGLPMVTILHSKEERIRRKYYGQAGDFRIPAYGLEYRTLSSQWLTHPSMTSLVFGLTKIAAKIYESDFEDDILEMFDDNEVKNTINKNHRIKARELVKLIEPYIIFTTTKWQPPFINNKARRTIFKGLQKYGVEKIFGTDILKNWGIKYDKRVQIMSNSAINTHLWESGMIASYGSILLRLLELGGKNK